MIFKRKLEYVYKLFKVNTMSDLQLALIILGAIIIGGVVAYNWLQEKKLRQQVTDNFIVPQKDVLSDNFHIDADAYMIDKELAEVTEKTKYFGQHTIPGEMKISDAEMANNAHYANENLLVSEGILGLSNESPNESPNEALKGSATDYSKPSYIESQILDLQNLGAQTQESQAQELQAQESQAQESQAAKQPPTSSIEPIIEAALHEKIQSAQVNLPISTHAQIDLTAILYATKNINSADLSVLLTTLSNVGLACSICGLDNDDKWHAINDESNNAFKQLACSLQLADRGGPVAKNLLNKFQYAVEDAGLTLNAHVEWQGSGDVMQRAIELDQFCIEVDQMVSVHIAQTDTPIHGTKFKGLAEASGMTLKDDGKFYLDANDTVLFTAIDTNNVPFTVESLRNNVLKCITLQIEIPKVSNSEQVFSQMIAIAQKMANSLNANLVDDNQKPLGDLQIEKIRQQLKVIHATMVARGIMPGSDASMRLFS